MLFNAKAPFLDLEFPVRFGNPFGGKKSVFDLLVYSDSNDIYLIMGG